MESLVTLAIVSEGGGSTEIAVKSALSQTYQHIEVLTFDGAPAAADPRLRAVTPPASRSFAARRACALENARGEFITFLTSGDVLLPTFVEDAISLFQASPDTAVIVCGAAQTGDRGDIQGCGVQPDFDGSMFASTRDLAQFLLHGDEPRSATMMFSMKTFAQLGPIDESYTMLPFREYMLRCAAASANLVWTAKPQTLIRAGEDGASGAERTALRLAEYGRLVTHYTGAQFRERLVGFGPAIVARINQELTGFKNSFPDAYERFQPALDSHVGPAMENLAQLPRVTVSSSPRISVVIPYTGRLGELSRALATLCGQDYPGWEAVIVADHAPDPGGLIANMGLSDRARVVHTLRGYGGPSGSRNLGLSCTDGDIVTYLDEDNRFEAGYFTALAKAFADPAVMVTAGKSRIAVITSDGGVLDVRGTTLGPLSDGSVCAAANRLPLNAIAHRRFCTFVAGMFNTRFQLLEDWDFLIRLGRAFPITPLNAPACILCFDMLLRGHELFSRRTSEQWSHYTSRLQDIYNTYPVNNDAEQTGRQEYAAKLGGIVQSGVRSAGDSANVMAFVEALGGVS